MRFEHIGRTARDQDARCVMHSYRVRRSAARRAFFCEPGGLAPGDCGARGSACPRRLWREGKRLPPATVARGEAPAPGDCAGIVPRELALSLTLPVLRPCAVRSIGATFITRWLSQRAMWLSFCACAALWAFW